MRRKKIRSEPNFVTLKRGLSPRSGEAGLWSLCRTVYIFSTWKSSNQTCNQPSRGKRKTFPSFALRSASEILCDTELLPVKSLKES